MQFHDLGESWRRDERGMVYFPFQGLPESLPWLEMCRSCHLITIVPGQMRGQHQHPGKTEWLVVFAGEGLLVWRSRDGQLRERRLGGDGTMVVIPPGIPHTLRNDGPALLYLLAWRAALEPAEDKPDTLPEPLI